ncbi:MAG: tRNA pseudouridine(55) synthase TruB [Sphingomonas bacterium]|nr:tRNA pseudouridine(55) synthase TruB [Sphingomonas bacterium]
MHGWIILDKPLGLGSTSAVSAVKRALRDAGEPKTKVGHGGTLDPLASGVLPIALGEATKLAGRMLDATKSYDFTITFGTQTDTLDLEGQVIATSDHRPTRAEVKAILPLFAGPIEQIPPAYSALKVDGERAYDLARKGIEVELKSRSVIIHDLVIVAVDADHVTLASTVSKGTYIRSLARDIAIALGTVGHVSMLRRTRAGPFALKSAISLDNLADAAKARALTRMVLPLAAGLDDIPALPVTPDQAHLLRRGQMLFGIPATPGLHLATEAETPVALVEVSEDGCKVVRGFNL